MNSINKLSGGLAAGTLVTTPDGDKKIEDIKAGDLVLSGVGRDETHFLKVGKASRKSYHGPILNIETETGHQLRVTRNQICFGNTFRGLSGVANNAILLYAFDEFDTKTGRLLHHITRKGSNDSEEFDSIDLAEEAALRIARSDGGGEIERFANLTYYPIFDFMPAADLRVTMEVPIVKGKYVSESTIISIVKEDYIGYVYDLDIPEARNFAANGVLVHDSTRVSL